MSVEFNEENSYMSGGGQSFDQYRSAPKTSAMISMIMKLGIVKDEKQANYVLLGIVLFCVGIIVYNIFFAGGAIVATP